MRSTRFDRAFDAAVLALLALLLVLVAYPLYFVVIASVSAPSLVMTGRVLFWPSGFTLAGYAKIVEYGPLWTGYRNTLLYVVCQTGLSVTATLMAGFALARKRLPGRTLITLFMTITMFFSGGLIPTYLWMDRIRMVSKPATVVILGSIGAYNIFIARAFLTGNIPEELYEAASIDGCSHARFFTSVAVPLSPALLAVLTLFTAVGQWNAWFNAMVYLREESQMPLQMVLRNLIVSQTAFAQATDLGALQGEDAAQQALLAESMKYAIIIVSTLPILCLYPFVQRYFVRGIMVGSVKG